MKGDAPSCGATPLRGVGPAPEGTRSGWWFTCTGPSGRGRKNFCVPTVLILNSLDIYEQQPSGANLTPQSDVAPGAGTRHFVMISKSIIIAGRRALGYIQGRDGW